jgi:hypothetical protein
VKTFHILASALTASCLFAQDASGSLDARIQVFADLVQPRQFTYANAGMGDLKDQAKSSSGVGFRILGELPYTKGWYYELGGRLDSSGKLGLATPVVDSRDIKVTYSYWSAGVAYLWSLGPMAVGLHLEGRGEALAAQGEEFRGGLSSGQVSRSTTYLRPWARASVDFTLGSGKIRPFLGAEAAAALTRTDQTRIVPLPNEGLDDRTLRSMAPDFGLALYAGIRF